jgi:hypothetical protein
LGPGLALGFIRVISPKQYWNKVLPAIRKKTEKKTVSKGGFIRNETIPLGTVSLI